MPCGKTGHFARDCPEPKKSPADGHQRPRAVGAVAADFFIGAVVDVAGEGRATVTRHNTDGSIAVQYANDATWSRVEAGQLRFPKARRGRKEKRAARANARKSAQAVCAVSTGQLDSTGRVMKGVRAEKVTRPNWSGHGPGALKVGEVVPQLVGPLRGEGTNPLGTEFNTGVKGKSRHPSTRDVQALSRDLGIALIYDKKCRLDTDDPGYNGGHFRVQDNSDPNQPASDSAQGPDWGPLSIGAIVDDSALPRAFSDTSGDSEGSTREDAEESSPALASNYYHVLSDLDEAGHLN